MQRKEVEATSRALKQISPDCAEAIILPFFCGLSSSEVSHVLKKSTTTTRMLIARGIQELRTRSTLAPDEENTEDQGTIDSDAEDERLAKKLINIANQITPDLHFIAELENTLVANHLPNTKWTFSLQQIASLAGWALLIAAGVFLLNWRAIPNSASIKPLIANTGNAKSTAATETAFREGTSTPSPTVRATATSLPTLEYIVQAGDTCTYIAERFGVTIDQLIILNRLNDTCDIWIDQKLVIPIIPTPTPQMN
jgi:LysM repeat protein